MKTQGQYETSDLNLASFLRCRRFVIIGMRQQDGKTTFVFADCLELRQAVLEFANDGDVPVRSFCNTLRDFKALTR